MNDNHIQWLDLPCTGYSEQARLILRFAKQVLDKHPRAKCGMVLEGVRANTYFVWLDDGVSKGNLSEGCSGLLTAWYEAYEATR